ncbi:claudin-1 [Genypterus blacodes]|uniref:claudin-1 n=1 Tax=Genypterus blacodes TaxID=154954 RepID=UPI003F7656E4
MPSSGLQLLGFTLSLCGLAAAVAATFMVEWKRYYSKAHKIYEGMWMTCTGSEKLTCELHESLLKLPVEVQVTRAVMLFSILLSCVALLVSTVGMKCTRFMDGRDKSKNTAAMTGGILFMISGLLILIITSWYVRVIVQTFFGSHHLQRYEFGKAVFVSLGGALLSLAGGAFLSCRRCSGSSSSMSPTHLRTTPSTNYV